MKATLSCVFIIVIGLSLPGPVLLPGPAGPLKQGAGNSTQRRAHHPSRAVRGGIEERISRNSAQRRSPVVPHDMRVLCGPAMLRQRPTNPAVGLRAPCAMQARNVEAEVLDLVEPEDLHIVHRFVRLEPCDRLVVRVKVGTVAGRPRSPAA